MRTGWTSLWLSRGRMTGSTALHRGASPAIHEVAISPLHTQSSTHLCLSQKLSTPKAGCCTKKIRRQAAASQAALAARQTENRLHSRFKPAQHTSLPQLHLQTGHSARRLRSSGTTLLSQPSTRTDFTARAWLPWHLLSGTLFLKQSSIVHH